MPESAEKVGPSPRRIAPQGWRRIVFPVAAVLVALVPFVVLELILSVLGVAGPQRLFVLDASAERYVTNPEVLRWFEPQAFPRRKAPHEFRVFCVGASTVQGRPYRTATAFSTWLQIALASMDSAHRYRVVNVGGVSYASYRLRPVVEELLGYEPDLLVLYIGHNEFLEDRTRAGLGQVGWMDHLRSVFGGLRTYRLLQGGLQSITGSQDPGASEVKELLNRTVGLDAYHRDAEWNRAVVASYRRNLDAMVRAADRAGIALILVNPASNTSNCRPFKSQHRDGLVQSQQEQVEELVAAAQQRDASEPENSLELLAQAESIDPLYAETFYRKGKVLESLGRTDHAVEAYLTAKDLDVCPLRILESMRTVVEQIARQTGTPLVDARAVFQQAAGTPLCGNLFADHVHPTIEGHRLLANALADEAVKLGLVSPRAAWSPESRTAAYQEYFDQLLRGEPEYLVDGQLGLAQVLAWVHRYDEAEAQLLDVIEAHPRAAPAWLQLGQVHARLNHTEQAVADWERAVELEPERIADLLSVAMFEAESESYSAAQLALETLLRHEVPPLLHSEAQYALAVVLLLEDDHAGARRAFARINLTPTQLRTATRSAPPLSWWSRYRRLLPQLEALGGDLKTSTRAD